MTDINTSNAIAQERARTRAREQRMREELTHLSEKLYRNGRSVGFMWGLVAGTSLTWIGLCAAIIYHAIV